ncbi:MAG TPA: alpha-1,4-glucan--maltose-1-phosphate maltosyltransferase [Labilithrix sp.]|nr:alpha-1,4-glucan--maltose-1-phosphate maltosyltransferase [Labilithrix sp.]
MKENGRRRVLIESGSPEVDGGRYPAKRVVGEPILASCDLVSDGHDAVGGALLYKGPGDAAFSRVPLVAKGNDRWAASFIPASVGRWELCFEAWIDAFATWSSGIAKKAAAGQDIKVELLVGARLLAEAGARARAGGPDDEGAALLLKKAADTVGDVKRSSEERLAAARAASIAELVALYPDLENATRYDRTLAVTVDRKLARFGAWYEFFPRSCGAPGKHGTFADCGARLEYAASMGFDIVYLPPIHPIGRAFRKGPNNTLEAGPNDVGSPWAIGGPEGGHKAIHPELGTLDDFRAFVRKAKNLGLEIAIDVAFQVSPDHPYVKEHPEWFRKRPDGTIQYAENPPKKYQDVYPFDFEVDEWQSLWEELTSVFTFWIEQGVTVFRVDNPHTKSLRFWEWCIARVKEKCPEAIFLAEAFTRPKLMYALAKGGFTQSYTYFTWRHTKAEFTAYMNELTRPPVSDFYRPNFWPNTPDILPEHLQFGGRPMFVQRLVLAATLSSSYGIYGPAFELMEHVARPGAEEYIDNEKFELKTWNVDREDSLRHVITRINRIRRENPALQDNARLIFHPTDNDQLLCFSKSDGQDNVVIVVVNLDNHHRHSGWIDLDLAALGIAPDERFQVHDELGEARYQWTGPRNYVELDPSIMPAHVFRVRRKIRTEHDFEYFL